MHMKPTIRNLLALAAGSLALTFANTGFSQTTVTTTTSQGTISEFSPDTIVIRSEAQPEPLRYTSTKTTTYVDESGAPVSVDVVKSGLPVTVYYVKDGDRLIANRVVVRKQTTTTTVPSTVEERTTTTRTITK